MDIPAAFDGLHHVALTVSDLDRSVAFYRDVLGFGEIRRMSAAGLEKAMLGAGRIVITLVDHGSQRVEGAFSEHRAGLDHLSFAVPDEAALHAWVSRLDAAGISHGEVAQGGTGKLVAFRDPDNIALEFYSRS